MCINNLFSTIHTSGSSILYQVLFFILARGTITKFESGFLLKEARRLKPFDAIIIPGAPYQEPMNEMMKKRLSWSIYLFQEGYTHHIIYSGGAVYTPYIEAAVMAEFAAKNLVPRDRILMEEKAQHTVENLFFSIEVASKAGLKKIAFASDPLQCKFIRKFLHRTNLEVTLIPIVNGLSLPETSFPALDLSVCLDKNFVPIFKKKSFLQRLKGTLGIQYLK